MIQIHWSWGYFRFSYRYSTLATKSVKILLEHGRVSDVNRWLCGCEINPSNHLLPAKPAAHRHGRARSIVVAPCSGGRLFCLDAPAFERERAHPHTLSYSSWERKRRPSEESCERKDGNPIRNLCRLPLLPLSRKYVARNYVGQERTNTGQPCCDRILVVGHIVFQPMGCP